MNIPERNNFFASFTEIEKVKIKEAFENNGWTAKKVTPVDFKLTNAWSEFVLEGNDQKPLLTGSVINTEKNILVIDRLFTRLPGLFKYELYDEDDNLLVEKKSAPQENS
jgi:hypothetical protein